MRRVRFIDLYTKNSIETSLEEIPRTGDLLQLTNQEKFYIVRGVARTINEMEGTTNEIDVYLENVNQTYWMNSLAENH